ncbi:MAG: hypothetical protein M9941_14630 [Anaerolineae bacterium]|nr:hypothetical protein [Anaerolineae bacterium]
MRLFEIALVIVDALLLLFAPRLPRARRWLSLVAVVMLAGHLLLEGARWQMAPAYVLTAIIAIWALLMKDGSRRGGMSVIGRIVGLLILLLGTAAALVFPVPHLPALSGPYAVGTMVLHAVDPQRIEQYGSASDAPREIMLQVWYPTAADNEVTAAPYLDEVDLAIKGLAQTLELPAFMLSHVNLIDSGALAVPQPDTGAAPYPLLVFSHGWSGFRSQSTFLLQELASHGYVVASVDHPYDAAFVIFPDGRAIYNDPDVLGADGPDFEQRRNQLVRTRAADVGLAIDELEQVASGDSVLNGLIDFGRIGVFGHSTGGGTVIEFCGTDERCTAALGLDTWAEPVSDSVIESGLSQPLFMQFSQLWPWAANTTRVEHLLDNSSDVTGYMTIDGTAHWDFTNIPLLTPLAAALGFKGPLDGTRSMEIINTYALAFFDQQLKGIDTALLTGDSAEFPEVHFDMIQNNPR